MPTIDPAILARFERAHLALGPHDARNGELCALEWAAYLAGEEHSDHPECVCPVLGAFFRAWNDALGADDRDRVCKPFVPRLVSSKSTPEVETQRSYLALDWLIREFLPTWLEQVDALRGHAAEIRALGTIGDEATAKVAGPKVRAAWDAARVAVHPTVQRLQASASDLAERMLACGEES